MSNLCDTLGIKHNWKVDSGAFPIGNVERCENCGLKKTITRTTTIEEIFSEEELIDTEAKIADISTKIDAISVTPIEEIKE